MAESVATCEPETSEGEAFEMINLENMTVYLSDGKESYIRSDINVSAYNDWTTVLPWMKNVGVRYTTMAASCLYASPGKNDFTSDTWIQAAEPWEDGPVIWGLLALNSPNKEVGMGGCYPDACDGSVAVEGSIKFYQIAKCHRMVWYANTTQTILTDPWDNKYIMHATGCEECSKKGEPYQKDQIKMPDGWSFETVKLDSDIDLFPTPAESTDGQVGMNLEPGSFPCMYTLIQDAHDNSFHRFHYTDDVELIKKLILIPQPNIWMMQNASWFIPVIIISSILVLVLMVGCVYKLTCGAPEGESNDKAVELES